MIPSWGVVDAFGGYTPEFYNAMGFFILSTRAVILFTLHGCQINRIRSLGCFKYLFPYRKRCLVSRDQSLREMKLD